MKIPNIKSLLSLSFFLAVWLTGCGKSDPEIEAYKQNMNQFFENITYYDETINNIDPESDSAVADLLAVLDSMAVSFNQMAELPVPDVFIGVAELADDAGTYMTEAVSLYHRAFEEDSFNEYVAEAAKENYDRANLRLGYIISILHGDIPEDIIVMEGEEGYTETGDGPDSSGGDSSGTGEAQTEDGVLTEQNSPEDNVPGNEDSPTDDSGSDEDNPGQS